MVKQGKSFGQVLNAFLNCRVFSRRLPQTGYSSLTGIRGSIFFILQKQNDYGMLVATTGMHSTSVSPHGG